MTSLTSPGQKQRGFWYCFLVEGVLKIGVLISIVQMIGDYYVIPWYTQKAPMDYEYSYKWIIGRFLVYALLPGFIYGFWLWLKDEQEEKKKQEGSER